MMTVREACRISEVLIGFQKRYGYFESYGSEKLQELTP